MVLTPTYSGCPATELIESNVVAALEAAGFTPVSVTLQRAPAWTTDWISAEGKTKLRDYGIAPPGPVASDEGVVMRFMPRPQSPRAGLPTLWQRQHRAYFGLWLHRMQGTLPLPGLQGAV